MRVPQTALLLAGAALLVSGCSEKRPAAKAKPAATAPTIAKAKTKKPQPAAPAPAKPVQAAKPQLPKAVAQKEDAKPDATAALIQEAEREYEQGQADYKAGNVDAARESFNDAVDILTEPPEEAAGDARIAAALDRIVAGIHAVEIAGSKDDDGTDQQPEQPVEPAPIDQAAGTTVKGDPATTAKAAAELLQTRSDLPLMINGVVAGYIDFFTKTASGKDTLLSGWRRAGRYKDMIRRVLKEEGVPQDLFYLAQAESGFRPRAVSRMGARGMWQFMRYTAPIYGLKRNWWVDERHDPERATRAAARHLKDLFKQFGDWYLAIAAYNSGAGNVQRGVQRTGYADFWELYKRNVLPSETKNYVPIIIAMTIIAKNPEQYALSEHEVEPPEIVDVVETDHAIDLRLVSEAIDTPVSVIADLNPSLLRKVTPKSERFELKLPAGTKEQYERVVSLIPRDKRAVWRCHTVGEGDTLASIARKYRTTAKAITQVNNLETPEIVADAKLVIPVGRRVVDAPAYAKNATKYTVQRGDTIISIAEEFGVPAAKIRQWNGLSSDSIRAGRTLRIHEPVSRASKGQKAAGGGGQ